MSYVETASIPQELHSLVEMELQSGERITWIAQPVSGRLARSTWPVVLFGIPWTAFAANYFPGNFSPAHTTSTSLVSVS